MRGTYNKKKEGGIALIEVLISILLFSLGILALVGLQASMNKNVTQAKLRGEASFLANQLIGQMWADWPNLASYAVTDNACDISGYANCTNWLSSVNSALPSGAATVTVTGQAVDITVNWTLPGEAPSQLQIGTNIND